MKRFNYIVGVGRGLVRRKEAQTSKMKERRITHRPKLLLPGGRVFSDVLTAHVVFLAEILLQVAVCVLLPTSHGALNSFSSHKL